MNQEIFSRTERLLGNGMMERMADVKVIIFGVGGVGSWCAECLVRTGVKHLTIVDIDEVTTSNINRQLMATCSSVGRPKVEVLKERLLDINPEACIDAMHELYNKDNTDKFHLENYDYIIDAIDSLEDKAQLILHATRMKGRFYSSMGAALKLDTSKIEVGEFWKVHGCPLAKALRNRFKRTKQFPNKKFKCVFSSELLENMGERTDERLLFNKIKFNGSLCHITATFGMHLAGLVIQDIYSLSEYRESSEG